MVFSLDREQAALHRRSKLTAGWYLRPAPGLFIIEGADRVQFLQRQSTNDVRSLNPERAVSTVLTSPTARILDVLTLIMDEESIRAATLPGLGQQTYRFLHSRIFFMDKVSLTDVSAHYTQIELAGPLAAGLLIQAGIAAGDELDAVRLTSLNGGEITAIQQESWNGKGYLLLANQPAAAQLVDLLRTSAAVELDEATYQVLRIEAGLPAPGTELSEDYTPLETNLTRLISNTKGCYTGQEVIARQVTYDKITQHLCGLRLERTAAPGSKVQMDGRMVGEVRSSACSPVFGPIALAVLKKPACDPGSKVSVLDAERIIAGQVSPLPFQD